MDSKRRKVEVHIWDQPFFSELDERGKLFWWFIICKCDNVGVYQHNRRLSEFHCHGQIDLKEFVRILNQDQYRVEELKDDMIWIRSFVRETWGTLTAETNLGRSCWLLLIKHKLTDRFIDSYPDCIKIETYREAISKGELPAFQSEASNRSDIENVDFEEMELQGSDRPVAYNYSYNKNKNSTSNSDSISSRRNNDNSLINVAERCLKVFPQVDGQTFLSETNAIVNKLSEMKSMGIEIPEAEKILTTYLNGERLRLKQTDQDYDVGEIIETFIVDDVVQT
ncbi:MAG: hypothetical protein GVY20_08685 [Bacteroidetes bacterium]|jgi:hypothetical protein|nr:hypothetical protein [Bacteroidota bacterium]